MNIALSEDGYLLSKQFHSSKIIRSIDTSAMYIPTTEDRIRKRFIPEPKSDDEKYVRDFYEYNDPQENDVIVYYDDIEVLSGTAGYALLRDGYVWCMRCVRRS